MNKIFLLALILFFGSLQSQRTSACKCTNLTKFEDSIQSTYKNIDLILEKAKSKEKALKKPFDFIDIKTLKKPAMASKIVDSLELKYTELTRNKVPDSIFGFDKIRDSLRKNAFEQKYYGIPKPLILKSGKIGNTIGILYKNNSTFFSKYYLYISNDNGETWKNYFTGLYINDPYFLKSNSKLPLWNDKNHIQIEADIQMMTEFLSFPGGNLTYKTIKNNALLTINLNEILKDSDSDGWNDLDEKMNYFTNPFSKDTDNDGIIDSEDKNPKYTSIDNDFTKIFQSDLFGNFNYIESPNSLEDIYEINVSTFHEDIKKHREEINRDYPKTNSSFVDDLDIKVIVTDDENLRRINTFNEKIIFLTTKEYKEYQKINPFNLFAKNYSKIYKCDDLENTYILKYDGVISGVSFLITKTLKGYRIIIFDNWIT